MSAAALGVSYPEAERILQSARTHLEGTIGHFDDGTGADPYGRLVRGVPGPPDSLADRVWVTVDAALVPDYAGDGAPVWGDDHAGLAGARRRPGRRPAGVGGLRRRARPGGPRARGQGGPPGGHDPRRRRGRAARRAGHRRADRPPEPGGPGRPGVDGRGRVHGDDRGADDRGADDRPRRRRRLDAAIGRRDGPPPDPDLRIVPTGVPPHTADEVQLLNDPTVSRPDPVRQADVAVRSRYRDGTSSLVVRRVDPDGSSNVWLVTVQGEVRNELVDQPDALQGWTVDGGGVILALRIAGHPDLRVLAGLRAGGGGTWLRLPDRRAAARSPAGRLRALPRGLRAGTGAHDLSGDDHHELTLAGATLGRPSGSAGGGEALLERGQLVAQLLGQVVAELGVVLLDLRDGGPPALDVDGEQLVEVVGVHVEAVDVERARCGQVADRRLDRRRRRRRRARRPT